MDLNTIINQFKEQHNIKTVIHTDKFTPVQIFYQLEENFNKVLDRAYEHIKLHNINNEASFENLKSDMSTSSEDVDTINAKKAIEMLDRSTEDDEDDLYTDDEIYTSQSDHCSDVESP